MGRAWTTRKEDGSEAMMQWEGNPTGGCPCSHPLRSLSIELPKSGRFRKGERIWDTISEWILWLPGLGFPLTIFNKKWDSVEGRHEFHPWMSFHVPTYHEHARW